MSLQFADFAAPEGFGVVDDNAPEVRNPKSAEFIRVHPEWQSPQVLLARVGSRIFLVRHDLTDRLRDHLFTARLVAVASSESGTYFLWPVKADNQSAGHAADQAKGAWIRIEWENARKAYATQVATDEMPDPTWPFADFAEMAERAFGDRKVSNPDDAVVKKLLGESAKAEA